MSRNRRVGVTESNWGLRDDEIPSDDEIDLDVEDAGG